MYSNLTAKQQQVLRLASVGFSAKEIAEETGATTNTINTHLKNIKERLGLQKISELAAFYWCEFFGTSLEEQRKQILAACLCMVFLFSTLLYIDTNDKRRIRFRCRRENTQSVENYISA